MPTTSNLVIHLAGDACGARPTPEHVHALYQGLGDAPLDPLPQWSYTQWEYQLGLRFERNTLVYVAAPETPRDCALPVPQTDEEARLQQLHLQAIRQSGKHRAAFTTYNTLVREVFHDLGLEPERKINNLPYKTLGSLFKGREEFLSKIHDTLGRAELHGFERSATISASATAVAMYGLGGSGTPRTAIEYALRYESWLLEKRRNTIGLPDYVGTKMKIQDHLLDATAARGII